MKGLLASGFSGRGRILARRGRMNDNLSSSILWRRESSQQDLLALGAIDYSRWWLVVSFTSQADRNKAILYFSLKGFYFLC